jgi:hypothetical protein
MVIVTCLVVDVFWPEAVWALLLQEMSQSR